MSQGHLPRVIPAWDNLAATKRLRFEQPLNRLGRRSRAHLLQILDSVLVLNHFDELFIDLHVLDSDVLTILQWYLDAELVQLGLLVTIVAPVFERRIVLLKLLEQAVSHYFLFY